MTQKLLWPQTVQQDQQGYLMIAWCNVQYLQNNEHSVVRVVFVGSALWCSTHYVIRLVKQAGPLSVHKVCNECINHATQNVFCTFESHGNAGSVD